MKNEKTADFRTARPVSGELMSMFEIALPDGGYEYFDVMYSQNYIFVANHDGTTFEAFMERTNWFDLGYDLQLFHDAIVKALESGGEVAGELH